MPWELEPLPSSFAVAFESVGTRSANGCDCWSTDIKKLSAAGNVGRDADPDGDITNEGDDEATTDREAEFGPSGVVHGSGVAGVVSRAPDVVMRRIRSLADRAIVSIGTSIDSVGEFRFANRSASLRPVPSYSDISAGIGPPGRAW